MVSWAIFDAKAQSREVKREEGLNMTKSHLATPLALIVDRFSFFFLFCVFAASRLCVKRLPQLAMNRSYFERICRGQQGVSIAAQSKFPEKGNAKVSNATWSLTEHAGRHAANKFAWADRRMEVLDGC
jgi:hypothetical protein